MEMYLLSSIFKHTASELGFCADGFPFVRPTVFTVFDGRSGPVWGPACKTCEYGHKPDDFS